MRSGDERPEGTEESEADVLNKGWNEDQRERLEAYRNDESPMVAEKAWEVQLPDEEEAQVSAARQFRGRGGRRGFVGRMRGRGSW